jgi:hypothetical protein
MAKARIDAEARLDATKFKAGIRGAEAATERFKTRSIGAFNAIGGAIAAFGIGRGLTSILEKYDRIGKLSTRLNVPAEFIQRMGVAADLTGTSTEGLVKNLSLVNKQALQATRGSKTVADAFARMGIDAEKYLKLDMPGQLAELARGFNSIENENEARANLQLLARGAEELIPLLKDFDNVKKSINETPVVSEEDIRRMEHFNDQLTIMKARLAPLAALSISGLTSLFDENSVGRKALKDLGFQSGDIDKALRGRNPAGGRIASREIGGAIQQSRQSLLESLIFQRQQLKTDLPRMSGQLVDTTRMEQQLQRLNDQISQLKLQLGNPITSY